MKRFLLSLAVAVFSAVSALGMSLRDAQTQAYFLSDKMAYELNLTPWQYDQVYQVNLEYFLNINSPYDANGYFWNYRNTDLSYILYDWQWNVYRATEYFLRPLRWVRGAWYSALWDYYHRDYYFYHRPTIYAHCHGGLWHGRHPHSASPFIGHRPPHHSGGMNHHYGKPGKPGGNGYRPGHGGKPQHDKPQQPDNNGRHPGYRESRPASNGGAQPGYNGSGTTTRPSSGTSARPSSGTTTRPSSGTSARPEGSNGGATRSSRSSSNGYRPSSGSSRSASSVRPESNSRSRSSAVTSRPSSSSRAGSDRNSTRSGR